MLLKRRLFITCISVIIITAAFIWIYNEKPEALDPSYNTERPFQQADYTSPNVTPIPSTDPHMETTIAQSEVDWDGDDKSENLSIVMTEGELQVDDNPGAFEGEWYVGKFATRLTDSSGKLLHEYDLTTSFRDGMRFRKGTYEIAFDDYNNDGYPDFTIGQYATSNGDTYNLFTIKQDGFAELAKGIFSASRDFSLRFEKATSTAFYNRYYDNSRGDTFQSTFVWNGALFKKIGEARVNKKGEVDRT